MSVAVSVTTSEVAKGDNEPNCTWKCAAAKEQVAGLSFLFLNFFYFFEKNPFLITKKKN